MYAQMENFIRKKEILIKIKILGIKKFVSEMNSSIDWLVRRLEAGERRVNKLEVSYSIIQNYPSKTQRGKKELQVKKTQMT